MAGIYRPRHPERTLLYRVLFHYFDRFLSEYESRFEREYGLPMEGWMPLALSIR
jgi:hypothetical protein